MFAAAKALLYRRPAAYQPKPTGPEVATYPAPEAGYPVWPVELLIEHQARLIARIRSSAPVSEELWQSLYMDAIRGYASFVHALPASKSDHHRLVGGLFRHGLEVAQHALQISDGKHFRIDPGSKLDRRAYEKRARFACFLAGLQHDLGKAAVDQIVFAPSGERWSPDVESIPEFAHRLKLTRYYAEHVPQRTRPGHIAGTAAYFSRVTTPAALAYLAEASVNLKREFMEVITGHSRKGQIVHDIVMAADGISVARDRKSNGQLVDGVVVGKSVPERFYEVLAAMIGSQPGYKTNVPGSKLVCSDLGVWAVWPSLAEDVYHEAIKRGVAGFPSDPTAHANLLIEWGLAGDEVREGRTGEFSRLAIEYPRSGGPMKRWALQLTRPDLLYGSLKPMAIPITILDEEDRPLMGPLADALHAKDEADSEKVSPGADQEEPATEKVDGGEPSQPRPPAKTKEKKPKRVPPSLDISDSGDLKPTKKSATPALPASIKTLDDAGAAGSYVKSLARAISRAKIDDSRWRVDDGQLHVAITAAEDTIGIPRAELTRELTDQRLIDLDPAAPARGTWKLTDSDGKGRFYLKFTREVTGQLQLPGSPQPEQQPESAEPAPAPSETDVAAPPQQASVEAPGEARCPSESPAEPKRKPEPKRAKREPVDLASKGDVGIVDFAIKRLIEAPESQRPDRLIEQSNCFIVHHSTFVNWYYAQITESLLDGETANTRVKIMTEMTRELAPLESRERKALGLPEGNYRRVPKP